LGGDGQLLAQDGEEGRRFDEVPAALASAVQPELGEDCGSLGASLLRFRPPFVGEPGAELSIAIRGVEDVPDHELRGNRPVPAIRLEPEGDVVVDRTAVAIELAPLAERDPSRTGSIHAHRELEMLSVAHRAEL